MSGMWLIIAGLFFGGVLLNSLSSGCETGFYRVNRVRLVLDARGGDLVSRGLWWLSNHPALFIATTLIGNNAANYLVSLAVVLGTQRVAGVEGHWAEVVMPVVLTPLLFIYGDLLPKRLYYEAPNRMLRQTGPVYLFFTAVFFVPTALLWGVGRVLEWISGESPERVKLTLARQELQQVLEEGHETGVLRTTQRALAQVALTVADEPITDFMTPLGRVLRVRLDMPKGEMMRLARRHGLTDLVIEEPLGRRRIVGYMRLVDLYLEPGEMSLPLRDLIDVSASDSQLAALMKLQTAGENLARVVDAKGNVLGIVSRQQLVEPLLRGA